MANTFRHDRSRGSRGEIQPEVIAGLGGALVLALVGAWFFLSKPHVSVSFRPSTAPPPPLALPSEIQNVKFSDGSSLSIHKVGVAMIECGTLTVPAGHFGSSGSSEMSIGGGAMSGSSAVFEVDGAITGMRWSCPPGNLLILCRLLETNGTARDLHYFHWNGEIKGHGCKYTKFEGWDAMISPSADPSKLPEVFVQMSDGAGGWIDGGGPWCNSRGPHSIAMLAFPAWLRSAPELEFRAVRPGLPPVSWKLPNPLHPVTPARWKVDTLPITINDPEFDLKFNGPIIPKDWPIPEGWRKAVQADYEFTSKLPEVEGLFGNQKSLQCECVEVSGALGTRVKEDDIPVVSNYLLRAFRLPPDESLIRFHFVVSATEYYRYPREEAVLLAKGKVSADGLSIIPDATFKPGHGVLASDFEVPAPPANEALTLKLDFKWNNPADRNAAELALLLKDGQPVCFVADRKTSIGRAHISDRSASSSGGVSEADMKIEWDGIPIVEKETSAKGTATHYRHIRAKPGDEIVIGMVKPRPDKTYEFTTARPAR